MPVDEDFNLDSPNGISEDEIRAMEEEAERIEATAQKADEAVRKFKESTRGLTFAQLNILEGGLPSTGGEQDSNGSGGVGNLSKEELVKLIVEMMESVETNKEKSEENKSDIEKLEEEQKKAEAERRKLEAEIKSDIQGGEQQFYTTVGALNNPISFASGKAMQFVKGAGIVGLVISIVWKMGEFIYNKWMDSFKAGGVNDVRKLVDDRTRELVELDDMLARRNGRVFYSGDINLQQGVPQFSNTERLRDQMVRYEALHLGE